MFNWIRDWNERRRVRAALVRMHGELGSLLEHPDAYAPPPPRRTLAERVFFGQHAAEREDLAAPSAPDLRAGPDDRRNIPRPPAYVAQLPGRRMDDRRRQAARAAAVAHYAPPAFPDSTLREERDQHLMSNAIPTLHDSLDGAEQAVAMTMLQAMGLNNAAPSSGSAS